MLSDIVTTGLFKFFPFHTLDQAAPLLSNFQISFKLYDQ